jgi:hypothetical protein
LLDSLEIEMNEIAELSANLRFRGIGIDLREEQPENTQDSMCVNYESFSEKN